MALLHRIDDSSAQQVPLCMLPAEGPWWVQDQGHYCDMAGFTEACGLVVEVVPCMRGLCPSVLAGLVSSLVRLFV